MGMIRYTLGTLALAGAVGFGSYQLRGYQDSNKIENLIEQESVYQQTINSQNKKIEKSYDENKTLNEVIITQSKHIDIVKKQNEKYETEIKDLTGKLNYANGKLEEISTILEK